MTGELSPRTPIMYAPAFVAAEAFALGTDLSSEGYDTEMELVQAEDTEIDPALFGLPAAVTPAGLSVVVPARSGSEIAPFRPLPSNVPQPANLRPVPANVALAAHDHRNVVAPSPTVISRCPRPHFIREEFDNEEAGISDLRDFVNDCGYDLVTARTHYHRRTKVLKHVVLKCFRRAAKRTPEQGTTDCQFQLSVRKREDHWILTVDHGLGHNHSPDLPGPFSLADFALPADAATNPSSLTTAPLQRRYEIFVMQDLIKSMLREGASIGQILDATRTHDPGTVIEAGDIEDLRQMLRVEIRRLSPRGAR